MDQAWDWGLTKPPVVLADAADGEVTALREALEGRDLAYAVGISKALAVGPEPPARAIPAGKGRGRPTKGLRFGDQKPVSVQELAVANQKRFRTVRWREGRQGPLVSRCWAQRGQAAHGWNHGQAPGKEVWLLGEWPAEERVQYYLCDLPKNTSLRQWVAPARGRWRVEQDYQQRKEEWGLDHFEGRSWTGWYHQVTMVMLAHLFLRREQKRRSSKSTLDSTANSA